jgi:hypothetical protein
MLEQLFAQIQKQDPGSDAFRFPFDVKGNRSHASLSRVNVRSLYESVHQAVDLLGNLKEVIADNYERASDQGCGHSPHQKDGGALPRRRYRATILTAKKILPSFQTHHNLD